MALNDFGDLGRAYVETDKAEADEATIIDNILSGQYSHPLRVIAFNTAEGWSRDVTEDIAVAVMKGLVGEYANRRTRNRQRSLEANTYFSRTDYVIIAVNASPRIACPRPIKGRSGVGKIK